MLVAVHAPQGALAAVLPCKSLLTSQTLVFGHTCCPAYVVEPDLCFAVSAQLFLFDSVASVAAMPCVVAVAPCGGVISAMWHATRG